MNEERIIIVLMNRMSGSRRHVWFLESTFLKAKQTGTNLSYLCSAVGKFAALYYIFTYI